MFAGNELGVVGIAGTKNQGMVGDANQFAGNAFGREDKINGAGGDDAARHAVMLGGGLILSEGDAALGMDFGHAQGAVGARTRKNHANGVGALIFGERAHEGVDGHGLAANFFAGGEVQSALGNGHGGVWGDDVNAIGLDDHGVANLADGHGSFFGNELGKQAVMLGVEMLDEDEGHAGVWREVAEQLGNGFQAARGSSDGNNEEMVIGTSAMIPVAFWFGGFGGLCLHRSSRQQAANREGGNTLSPPTSVAGPE